MDYVKIIQIINEKVLEKRKGENKDSLENVFSITYYETLESIMTEQEELLEQMQDKKTILRANISMFDGNNDFRDFIKHANKSIAALDTEIESKIFEIEVLRKFKASVIKKVNQNPIATLTSDIVSKSL